MTIKLRPGPRRRRALATALVGLVVGVALMAVGLSQGASYGAAIAGLAIVVAVVAVLLIFQYRSETVSTLAGDPVDERWKLINERALANTTNVSAVFGLAAYGIAQLSGRESWQFALMLVVIALSYIGGVVWFRRQL